MELKDYFRFLMQRILVNLYLRKMHFILCCWRCTIRVAYFR